jgi:hypothetical protein
MRDTFIQFCREYNLIYFEDATDDNIFYFREKDKKANVYVYEDHVVVCLYEQNYYSRISGTVSQVINSLSQFLGPELNVGSRIELHPGTDHWMRGDRFGTITNVTAENNYKIKLDVSRKTFTFAKRNILKNI